MNIEEISNYRLFLRQFLAKRAPKGRGEIAKLAEAIGVHPTFVSQVLASTKDFNLEQGLAITEYLNLSEIEKKYFLLLLQKDRAGTQKLKAYFKNELDILKKSLLHVAHRISEHRALTSEEKAIFYSSWIYSAIRLFCSVGPGKTLEQITEHFSISRRKALQILDFLTEKNLCVKAGSFYKMGTQHTHIPSDSPFIVRHHMNWRTKALQLHESMTADELAFTAPMSISEKDFKVIREKVLECIKSCIETAKESPSEEVAFLNIDWLWVKPKG